MFIDGVKQPNQLLREVILMLHGHLVAVGIVGVAVDLQVMMFLGPGMMGMIEQDGII